MFNLNYLFSIFYLFWQFFSKLFHLLPSTPSFSLKSPGIECKTLQCWSYLMTRNTLTFSGASLDIHTALVQLSHIVFSV